MPTSEIYAYREDIDAWCGNLNGAPHYWNQVAHESLLTLRSQYLPSCNSVPALQAYEVL